jgi:hypothetical protein
MVRSLMGDTMRKSFAAFAFAVAATLAQPASAITFPSLTTIYVGTGVTDSATGPELGFATAFQCSNVSGSTAQIRFLVLELNGSVVGSHVLSVAHGGSVGVSTHATAFFDEDGLIAPGDGIIRGTVNIESTQSGVFCQAYVTEAAGTVPNVVPLKLVRINPHPGTVE